MEILLVASVLILSFITFIRNNLRRTPLAIFLIIWGGIVILYAIRLYGIFNVSSDTLKMYFLGIISFSIGYLLESSNSKLNIKYKSFDGFERLKRRTLFFCAYLGIAVLFVRGLKAVPYWLNGNISELKSAIVDNNALSIGIIGDTIYTFIAKPVVVSMIIYSTILIISRKKNKNARKVLLLTLALIILSFIASGSKTSVSQILFMMGSYLFLYVRTGISVIFRIYKKLIIGLGLVGIVIVNLLLLSGDDFVKSLYFYFVGCIPCSDYAMNELATGPRYLGIASLNGIIRVLFIIPWMFGFVPALKVYIDYIFLYMQQFEATVLVAPDIPYNAFISMFSYFFVDGGYNGVVIGSFLFGFICSYCYKRSLKRPSYQSISIVLLLVDFIILSMVRFQLSFGPNSMALLIIIFLFPTSSCLDRFNNIKEGSELK